MLILGAGFAGLSAAEQLEPLAARGAADVLLVDGAPAFQMGFAMQWALAGRRPPEAGSRPYGQVAFRHVRFLNEEVRNINTQARTVQTTRSTLGYDWLVVAMGAQPHPGAMPGLASGAFDLFTMESVLRLRAELMRGAAGTVVVLVAGVPFKCPPAPYEYALLIDDLLRERGVRDAFTVEVVTPEPQPMPVAGPEVGRQVQALLAARGVALRTGRKAVGVDPAGRSVRFEEGDPLKYTVLAAVPPHRAPPVVAAAGLCDASGFVPVQLGSFATKDERVFAVGDVAALQLPSGKPHPKAGVFAEAQGAAVAQAIAARVAGGEEPRYAGQGTCFVDVGAGQAAAARADLLAEGGPRFSMDAPSARALEEKAAFEAGRLARWFRAP